METKRTSLTVSWAFILTILLIYPLPQIAIDIYLPSWPTMVKLLRTNNHLLQDSLTIYVLCLGIAQLIYGPLSERFGRKPMLLLGFLIFFCSSIACLFVKTIEQLLLLRAIQGLGIGCGFTIASTILADLFAGKRLAQMTSYSAMIYSLAIIFAPALGGYLQYFFYWQANFLFMVAYTLILLTLIWFFVFETKRTNQQALSLNNISYNYFILLKKPAFISNIICLILAYSIMITVSVLGPFLMQDTFHLSAASYGTLLCIIGFCYFLGATINSFILKYFTAHKIITVSLVTLTLAGICFSIACQLMYLNVIAVSFFVCVSLFCVGFIYPNCFANALSIFPENSYASAFIGSAILMGVALTSMIVPHYEATQESYLAFCIFILAFLSTLSYMFTKKLIT